MSGRRSADIPSRPGDEVDEVRPYLGQDIPGEPEDADNGKNLKELEPVLSPHFGLDKFAAFSVHLDGTGCGREPTGGYVLLHEGVLLVPSVSEPQFKFLAALEGDIGDAESPPVEIDRLGRTALEVCAGEAKIVLTKLATAIRRC